MSGSEYEPPVDEPPGKDGHQGAGSNQEAAADAVPTWPPGANTPGTNPPIPTPDTATTPIPGSIPGVVVGQEAPVPIDPPVNVDVPFVSQTEATLNCTMGNWEGEPTSYAYLWAIDGVDSSTTGPDYPVAFEDVGKTASCIVTATNAAGSTVAPPSNEIVIT